jgi:hypothetical protein
MRLGVFFVWVTMPTIYSVFGGRPQKKSPLAYNLMPNAMNWKVSLRRSKQKSKRSNQQHARYVWLH